MNTLTLSCDWFEGGGRREDEPGPGRGDQGGSAHRAGRGEAPLLYTGTSLADPQNYFAHLKPALHSQKWICILIGKLDPD